MSAKVIRLRRRPKAAAAPPRRRSNSDARTLEYLTPAEVERLRKAASKRGRYGQRDATAILIAYRHGLRVSELVDLRWDQVDLKTGLLHVRRAKSGTPSTHPMQGDELRALRELRREWPADGGYVFLSEREGPMTAAGARKMLARLGELAGFPFTVHPHMLRHACGFALANAGHDTRALQHWLGHKNIQHTVRYTELSPARFKNFWRE
ncbi:MAG TPA: tyrosine-type recombinase/integrase [Steroidobacteraceae bacterium]|nr:tyrosine-type recombinase/integrase [Steroidobacteraceae bacterium]